MSFVYLPEAVADCSPASTCSGGDVSATSKTMPIASESSRPVSGTDCSTMPRSGTMSEPSTGDHGVDRWIVSLRAFRASPFLSSDSVRANWMNAICGRRPFVSLAKSDPSGVFWKMSLACFIAILAKFSKTWPQSGLMLAGACYRLEPLEPHICGKGSGLWPTPRSSPNENRQTKRTPSQEAGTHGKCLAAEVQLWPTPRKLDGEINESLETWQKRQSRKKKQGQDLHKPLTIAVQMWPTPAARDWKVGGCPADEARHTPGLPTEAGGQLNPDFVAWLMNWPRGWASLEPLVSHAIMGCGAQFNGGQTNAEEERTKEALSRVRQVDDSQAIQGQTGGFGGLPAEGLLRPGVHGHRDAQRGSDRFDAAEASPEAPKAEMRTVRDDEETGYSPHGWESTQQCPRQPADIMRVLSCKVALGEWEETVERTVGLHNLWQACWEIGVLSKALPMLQEIWRSLSDEEKGWIALRLSTGNPWCREWPGTPRVATDVANRVGQLRALGNGQVPRCAAHAFRLLVGE